MKVAAIIQARMGSTRLPGKVLLELAGVPVIKHVYSRACLIEGVSDVVVVTPDTERDEPLVRYCREQQIPVLCGSEADVLDRYMRAARELGAEAVMRITADCPFIEPHESGKVLDLFLAHPGVDYASNIYPRTLPDGLDTEVLSRNALEYLWKYADEPEDREHVTYYVEKHPEEFSTVSYTSPVDYSSYRWTLDHAEDYRALNAIAGVLKELRQFGTLEELLTILREHPELGWDTTRLAAHQALES